MKAQTVMPLLFASLLVLSLSKFFFSSSVQRIIRKVLQKSNSRSYLLSFIYLRIPTKKLVPLMSSFHASFSWMNVVMVGSILQGVRWQMLLADACCNNAQCKRTSICPMIASTMNALVFASPTPRSISRTSWSIMPALKMTVFACSLVSRENLNWDV